MLMLSAGSVAGLSSALANGANASYTWTAGANSTFYSTNWSSGGVTGVTPVPVAGTPPVTGTSAIFETSTAGSTTDVINYDSTGTTSFNFLQLTLSATGSSSSSTFNLINGSTLSIKNSNSTIGANSVVNVNGSSTYIDNANVYVGSNNNSAASVAEIEINAGTFNFNNSDQELGVGYSGNFGQIDVGSTLNATAGTLNVTAYESVGTTNYGIGLRVGDGATAAGLAGVGTVNLNVGSVTLGTTANPSALLDGFRSVSNATTGSPKGTVNVNAGNWNNSGDVLIGYDGATTATFSSLGSAQGTLNISGGNFNVGVNKQFIVGASNGAGTLNLSGTGVINPSGTQTVTMTLGGSFAYKENFNPAVTGSTYVDGPTDGLTAYIAGTGTFNQSGGTANITTLNVGTSSIGTNVATGSAASAQGTGTYNLTGGTATITTLNVASNSLLAISGSAAASVTNLTVAPATSGTGANFSFTGGTLGTIAALTFNGGSTLTLASGLQLASTSLTENGNTTLLWSGALPTTTVAIATYSTLANGSGADLFVPGGTLASSGYTVDYSTSGTIYLDAPTSATPEPASMSIIGVAGLLALRRRRR